MAGRALAALLLLALGAAGCASNPASSLDAFAQRSASNSFELMDGGIDPPSTLMLAISHDRQTEGPSCGAHVLASVINYWKGPGSAEGNAIFASTPPANRDGYSMAELLTMARAHGLLASAVRLDAAHIRRELEAGRPVLVPVRVPSVFIQPWSLPGANEPVLGLPARIVSSRVGWISERTGMAMLNHYLLVAGYEGERFVVLEPILGFRTIDAARLQRYRRAFNNSAVVFSASRPASSAAPAAARAG